MAKTLRPRPRLECLEAEDETESKSLRPRPRPTFWPRGQLIPVFVQTAGVAVTGAMAQS